MAPNQELPEKRSDPRYLARIAIFYGGYKKEFLKDYSINISTGGVFIETNRILAEDTELTVKFNLPDSDAVIVTHAKVAWVNDPNCIKKSSLPPGMGIQFLSIDNLHTIRNFLEKGNFVPTWEGA
jgi:uncharacterized protein (TIGR02266 family)